MRVALEFPSMATVADVSEAWAIVERADHPNGAILLDIWHHRRSTGTDADLARVPPDRVFGIQVSDGTAEPVDRRSRTSSTVACRAKETSEWRNYLVISIIAGSVAQWAWRSPEGHPRRRRPSSRGAPAPCPHRCDRCFSMTAP
jgi:hypothetical protein